MGGGGPQWKGSWGGRALGQDVRVQGERLEQTLTSEVIS